MKSPPSPIRLRCWIAVVSAVLIAYQILLIRLLSLQYWSHFAYLIISIALIGFGASGTFLLLFRRRLIDRLPEFLLFTTLLLGFSLWSNYLLAHTLAFNPLLILWQERELLRFGALCLLLSFPFFLGASGIGLCMMTAAPSAIARLYAANLAGSGLGCLLFLLTVFFLGPREILLALSLAACGAGYFAAPTVRGKICTAAALAALCLLYGFWFRQVAPALSPYKDLSQARQLPAAQTEVERFGPLGLLTVVASPAFHYLPDLALNCPFAVPEQKGLFADGNTAGAIHRFSGSMETMRFLGWRTVSAAYLLTKNPDVLIVGGGAGTEILNALFHEAGSVTVLEMNGDILRLMREDYGRYGGGVYDERRVRAVEAEGRSYLETGGPAFDLIQVGLMESPGLSASGAYAMGENYLLTTEGISAGLKRLKPGGILGISRWVKNPPREELKLMATLIEAFEQCNRTDASASLIVLRSWQNVTFLLKQGVFSPEEVNALRSFCADRLFDISYCPGILPRDLNRINRLEQEYYYEAARSLLVAGKREAFYRSYPFHVRPATDDRPFFSDTFRISLLNTYLQSRDRMLVVLMDVGYLLVWLASGTILLAAFVLILLPLPLLNRRKRDLLPVLTYFGAIGTAYMFLEISFLQRLIRHLGDPAFSAAVVVGTLLVSSGAGSLCAGTVTIRPYAKALLATAGIVLATGLLLTADATAAKHLAQQSLAARMLVCTALLAPLGFVLGMPFPIGMERIAAGDKRLVPWAWGINGFCSVFGGVAAALLAGSLGLQTVAALALVLYLVATNAFRRMPDA